MVSITNTNTRRRRRYGEGDCFLEPRKLPPPAQSVVPSRPANTRSKLVMLESMDSSGWRYTFLDAILERFPPPMATALSPDFLMAADEAWRKISANVSAGPASTVSPRARDTCSLARDTRGSTEGIKHALLIGGEWRTALKQQSTSEDDGRVSEDAFEIE